MLGLKTSGLPDVSSATGAPVAPMPESVDGVDRPSKEVPKLKGLSVSRAV